VIQTERLLLRRWSPADEPVYAAILADPEVGSWIGVRDADEAPARMARHNAALDAQGYGRLAVVRRDDGRLIGHCGLMPIGADLPLAPGVEIGWALAHDAWGQGYALEAARAVIADGFERLGLVEITAFTTVGNLRSQAVMTRLGLERRPERDFDHPWFPDGHPLCRHLVFVARA